MVGFLYGCGTKQSLEHSFFSAQDFFSLAWLDGLFNLWDLFLHHGALLLFFLFFIMRDG
jgi:hypothetical protein